ncbi:hypothetical protein [Rhizorhabdus phycosphaerae]|uniref:hypothetical protein n=1 Tax=Rhizorhabdus phycosphaerae TaxID=2711156 RepID=UPI0013EB9D23|nr:hypothetical protein [Rhizorhabdus phycosphaerae]
MSALADGDGAKDALTRSRLILGVTALWLLACSILTAMAWPHVGPLEMWDPDDYLRLQQVRDWLGGQSFFDVTQYRIDPPGGVPMHWSRLVDLPLAAIILLTQPLIGIDAAERLASVVVPLVTLGGLLGAIALLTARLADRRTALLAAMLGTTAPLMLFHLLPLRIDHHGWQTMLGMTAIAAAFDPRPARGGALSGIAAALWLAVSLEALPMAGLLGLLLALRWIMGEDGSRFRGFATALGAGTLALFAATHDPAAWSRPWCDAMSPAWLGPLAATPLLAGLGARRLDEKGPMAKLSLLAAAAAVGAALLMMTAPICLSGPFGQLDRVVHRFWYENVPEGLPIWRQAAGNAMLLLLFPLVGLTGSLLAWRAARQADTPARDWATMMALAVGSFLLSMLVQRTGGFAQACALPGAAWLLGQALDRVGRHGLSFVRIAGSALSIMALSPIGAMVAGESLLMLRGRPTEKPDVAHATPSRTCFAPCSGLSVLAQLPPSRILTGLDLTPRLLLLTRHSYAASGHHRGAPAMRRVIDAFTQPPEAAHRLMIERSMTLLLIDPAGSEAGIYAKASPNGLMAMLLAGRAPSWLRPVPLPGSTLKLWRRTD